jgi:probable F420-dependent oxidoreductase
LSREEVALEAVRCFADGEVGVGITLPVQAQTTMAAEPWERDGGAAEILRIARTADRLGYFSVSASDHVAIPRSRIAAMSSNWYDPVATLGLVAGATQRVHLFTRALILPFRSPLLSAKAAATLDALSGGRLVLGVGAGHVEEEFAALGVDFTRRGPLLNEAIDVVDAILREEFPDVDSPSLSVHDLGFGPRPARRPRPPIWVGGSTHPALRRAAERGDGWFPQVADRQQYADDVAYLREQRELHHPGVPVEVGASTEPVYVGDPSWDVGAATISGPAEHIADSLRQLVDMGAQHLQLRLRSRSCDELEEQLELFASKVHPLLAG